MSKQLKRLKKKKKEELPELIHDTTVFRIGDRVQIIREAESFSNKWHNNWTPLMSSELGKIGTITSEGTIHGYTVRTDLHSLYAYPSFSLKKVDK